MVFDSRKEFLSFFIILFAFILTTPFVYSTPDYGCCINTVSGCQNLFTPEDIKNCQDSGFDFEPEVVCYPIPTNPDLEVTENTLCSQQGCCCLGDVFQSSLTEQECNAIAGTFTPGHDCYEACNVERPKEDLTCDRAGGFWCKAEDKSTGALDITNTLVSVEGRPSDDFYCWDAPCKTDRTCTPYDYDQPQFTGREMFCTDGRDNSGNCLVDQADPECRYSVQGRIIDQNGFPRSGVRIRFINTDHETHYSEFHVDKFTTYSVGKNGEFFFMGMSEGIYRAEIIDDFYNSSDERTFNLNPDNPHEDGIDFKIVPKNAFTIKGNIRNSQNNNLIPNAIISIEGTNLFAKSNSQGEYIINHVLIRPGTYSVVAYKEGFSLEKKTTTAAPKGEIKTIDFRLNRNDCEFSPSPPNLVNLSLNPGVSDITLNFNSGACVADKFRIYRCEGSDCNQISKNWVFVAEVPGYKEEYTDDGDLQWDTRYSYYVVSVTNDRPTEKSNILNILTGDIRCKDKQNINSFCIYESQFNFDVDGARTVTSSRGVYCDDMNRVQTYSGPGGPVVCGAGYQCVEERSGTPQSTTYCRQLDPCGPTQNNFFGLFFDKRTCQGQNNERFCVYDHSPTNVNYCYSCNQYPSCFSYRSRDACQENICNVGNCKWSVTNAVLGTGICYDEVKSECSDCNNPFNKFFGFCDPQTCSLIGDCAYSGKVNECKSCDEFSCYDYSDRLSCTGGVFNLRLNPSTNELLTSSKDACNIGSCRWSPTLGCYKDRDTNFIDDCKEMEEKIVVLTSRSGFSHYTIDVCLGDTRPPETSINLDKRHFNPLPPVNGKITITFDAIDRSYQTSERYEVKEIYYCITPAGRNNCRDRSNFETIRTSSGGLRYIVLENADNRLRIRPTGNKFYDLAPGKNIIRYFSVDHANNLEIIKEEEFFVDHTKPVLDLTITKMPQFDKKSTNVLAHVNADEPVFCFVDVQGCEDIGNCDVNSFDENNVTEQLISEKFSEFGISTTREFKSLPDGYFNLKAICTDLSGNVQKTEKMILLDADPRITNPRPFGPTDKNRVTLTVDTISDVTCRYTENINLRFNQISPSFTMSSRRKGMVYEHTAQISLSQSKPYIYYVKCDYSPVAIERIAFTFDRIPPKVIPTLGGRLPIPESGWIPQADVMLECEDEPEGGFGCDEIKYCIRQVPNINNPNLKANCNPDQKYNDKIVLEQPSTLCYNAKEKIINNEGGLVSSTECVNIFVDLNDPQIVVDPIPRSTNVNEIIINGKVYDNAKSHPISLSEDKDHERLLSNAKFFTSFLKNVPSTDEFDYLIELNLDLVRSLEDQEKRGKFYLIFHHTNQNSYGALVFNVFENTISFGARQGLLGFREAETKQLPDNFFEGEKLVRITREKNKISALISDLYRPQDNFYIETSSSLITNLFRGDFGVMIEDRTSLQNFRQKTANVFRELNLYFPDRDVLRNLDKKIYVSMNGNMKEIITTKSDFSFSSKLTEGIPRHGNSYEISLFAESVSGRTSRVVNQQIMYDLTGPTVRNLKFSPTFDQETDDYIEYETDAKISIIAEDDYSGVSKVIARVRDQQLSLTYSGNNVWEGLFKSSLLPVGNHDVFIEAFDGLNNKYVQTFEESLLIEDRIDPVIRISLDNPYFNTPTPSIEFKTDELATCSAIFDDENKETINLEITETPSLTHTLNVNPPLKHQHNREIKSDIVIICSDRNENKASVMFSIFVDLRKPIYSVIPNTFDLHLNKLKRHYAEYISVRGGERIFHVFADEPVKCRFDISDSNNFKTNYYDMTSNFLGSAFRYLNSDRTELLFFEDKNIKYFSFQCIDRAGNKGELKKIKLIIDQDRAPIILNLPEIVQLNPIDNLNRITFDGVRRRLSCSYTLLGETKNIVPSVTENILSEYRIDISHLPEGEHKLDVSCSFEGKTTSKSTLIYKYLDNPELFFNKEVSLSSSTSYSVLEVDKDFFVVEIDPSRKGTLKIKNSGTTINIFEIQTKTEFSIPLRYGINNLEFSITDKAGNYEKYSVLIVNKKEKPNVLFSNFLGGSIRRNYEGKLISNTDVSNFVVKIVGKSEKFSIDLNNENVKFTEQDLARATGNNNLKETRNNEIVSAEVYFDGKLIHKETFYFNPSAETIVLENPEYQINTDENLKNYNYLEFIGEINQENFAYEHKISYGDTFDDLNVSKSLFNREFLGRNNVNSFLISAENDLGVYFRILSAINIVRGGPSPRISLYPQGDVSFSSNPAFIVSFNEPAYIIQAEITNLSDIFQVINYNPSDLVFSKIIQTQTPLQNEGQYYLNLVAESGEGIRSEYQFAFQYSKREFTLELKTPRTGYSSTPEFTAEFVSDRVASCYYSFEAENLNEMEKFSDSSINHELPLTIADKSTKNVKIICLEFQGAESKVFNFDFTVDSEKPMIEKIEMLNAVLISEMPYIVEYPLSALINLSVNKKSDCRYDLIERGNDFEKSFTQMISADCKIGEDCYTKSKQWSVGNLADGDAYDLGIICKSKSGLFSDRELVRFQVDLSQGDRVRIISPEDYGSDTRVEIKVKTNFPTKNCSYRFGNDTVNVRFATHREGDTLHEAVVRLTEGIHRLNVVCDHEGTPYSVSKDFIIDSSKPLRGIVVVDESTSSMTRLNAYVQNFTDPESGIKLYEYAIGTAPFGREGWNSVVNWTQTQREVFSESALNLTVGTTYYWSVRALNNVNLYSDVVSSSGTTITELNLTQDDIDRLKDSYVCGPEVKKPCEEGHFCIFDEDCYNPELICERNICVSKYSIDDLKEPGVEYGDSDFELVPTDLIRRDVGTSIIRTSHAWLYWLLAFGMLILLAGGGYYAYMIYGTKEDEDVATKSGTTNKPTDTNFAGTQTPKEDNKKELERAKKKEELKMALKKKLVEDQKQAEKKQRSELFGKFSEDNVKKEEEPKSIKKESSKAKLDSNKSSDAATRAAKLRLAMRKKKNEKR